MSRFRLIIGILLIFITLFAYQNCGSGFGNNSPSLDEGASTVDAKVAAAPFPYDISVNALSYMSCPVVPENSGYYSYKVIASENKNFYTQSLVKPAGLALRSDFLTYMDANFKEKARTASAASIQTALMSADSAKNLRLQMSFRYRDDIQRMEFTKSSSEPVYAFMTDILSQENIAAHVSKMRNGKFATVVPGGSNGINSVAGGINLPSKDSRLAGANDQSSEQIRRLISDSLYLTFGFNQVQADNANFVGTKIMSPDAKSKLRAFGRGLQLQYGHEFPAAYGANPDLMLREVHEYDLSKSPPSEVSNAWSCFSYKIVKAADAATQCPKEENVGDVFVDDHRSKLQFIRKFLTADKWDVNTKFGCVVPLFNGSANGCYQDTAIPEYDFVNKPCGYGTFKECSHFVSFCGRQ